MLIDVECHLAGPFLLIFNEFIVEIIKFREFLVERHEFLIAHLALNILMMTLIEEMALLDELRQLHQSPVAERLVSRILPQEGTITVVDELDHAPIRQSLRAHPTPAK